ncbi:MAG: hypothetical protein Q8R57_03895 [Bacteroidota bacterium]|nr:hypothetical protein [Bacteroidota bacterium]
MFNKSFCLQIIFIIGTVSLLSSCRTSYQSGFDYHKNEINIDLSKHQLAYQISHDSLFFLPYTTQIDSFDRVFLTQWKNKILLKGYRLNQKSPLQTMTLENCLIDFSKAEPKLVKLTYDSFYIDKFATTLVCQSNQNKLFTATYDIYHDYEIKPKKNKEELEENEVEEEDSSWIETPHYFVYQKPISKNQANLIARNLSERAAHKIDSINKVTFTKNHPELAAKSVEVKKTSPVVDFFQVLGILALLLAVNLISL